MASTFLDKYGEYVVGVILLALFGLVIAWIGTHSPRTHTTNPGVLVCINELAINTAVAKIDSDDIDYRDGVFYVRDKYGHTQIVAKSVNDYCVTVPREVAGGITAK